jgi:hypothetical protein
VPKTRTSGDRRLDTDGRVVFGGPSAPTGQQLGDLWWDTDTVSPALKIWDGTTWTMVSSIGEISVTLLAVGSPVQFDETGII